MEIKEGELQLIIGALLVLIYMFRKELKKWGFFNFDNYKIFSKNKTNNKEAKSWVIKRLFYVSLIAVGFVLIINLVDSNTSSTNSKANRIGQC